MPVVYGKHATKSMGRHLSVIAHLTSSIVEVKAEENCLTHALLIAIARVDNDANYKAYRQGRKIRPVVQALQKVTGIDPTNGGRSPNLNFVRRKHPILLIPHPTNAPYGFAAAI